MQKTRLKIKDKSTQFEGEYLFDLILYRTNSANEI